MDQINETDFTTINDDVVTEGYIESAHDSDELEHNEAPESDFDAPPEYSIQDGMTYYESPDGPEPIMQGLAQISQAVRTASGVMQYNIRTFNPWGEANEFAINASDLTNDSVIKALMNEGLMPLVPKRVRDFLIKSAAACAGRGRKYLLERVGYHEAYRLYFSGSYIYADESIDIDRFEKRVTPLARMCSRGDLDDWKNNIGVHVVANDLSLFVVCYALASVLLERASLGSMAANLFGEKGTGKTLMLQLAASVFGNGSDPAHAADNNTYITRFAATQNALEPLMASYGCLPAILDELGQTDITDLGKTVYLLAGGSGKRRMNANLKLAEYATWRLHILLSGEVSIAGHITASGKVQKGGQADRAADIPLPPSGVFSDFGRFKSFEALTRHLKSVCGKYYGTLGEAFVATSVSNSEYIAAYMEELADYVDMLAPADCGPGERRVVQHFALSAIAGLLAVDFGLLDCDHDRIIEAHKTVTDLWWRCRAKSVDLIKDFIRRNSHAIKVRPPTGMDTAIPAVVDHAKGRIIIPVDVFNSAFTEPATVASELAELGHLIREQEGRHVCRVANNKLRAYCLDSGRFLDLLTELGLDKPRP